MKFEQETIDETTVTLDRYNSDLNLVIDAKPYSSHPLTTEGFAFMWAGVRATHGVTKSKVCFEVKVVKHLDVSHLPADEPNPHVVRVGFSTDSTSLQLGEEPLSWGYGGTGKISTNCKFLDYGQPFMEGDTILACLNMDSDRIQMGFGKNGKFLGWAYTFNKSELKGKGLFPHVLTKNCSFEVNFGQMEKPYFPLPDLVKDFVFINCLPPDQWERGTRAPARREDCEMIMMCGLPGAGKSVWAADYSAKNPEKKYNVLGTNNIIDKMKVMGLPRKRNYHGRWDVLIQMATKCLNKMFEIGSKLRRNYILDQTNVYPTAQRRKMRNFECFKRIAVVVVPSEQEYKRRCDKRDREEGKEIPDSAVLEMKANFKLPEKCDIFDDVIYTELGPEEAEKLVKQYNEEGRAAVGPPRKQFKSNDQGGSRFDSVKSPPFSNRGGGGSPGGRGGFNNRGGFDGNRGGFDGNRGGFDGNRGGFDGSRGGFDGSRGGRDFNRGGRGGFSGRGGFEGGRGGGRDTNQGGRGGFSSRGGFGGGRGGFDMNRGGGGGGRGGMGGGGYFDGGFENESYGGGRGGFGGGRGGYDGGSGGFEGSRGGYNGGRQGGGYGNQGGNFDGGYGGGGGGFDGGQDGGYDGGSGYGGGRGGRGGYDRNRGGFDGGRGGMDRKRGFDGEPRRFDQGQDSRNYGQNSSSGYGGNDNYNSGYGSGYNEGSSGGGYGGRGGSRGGGGGGRGAGGGFSRGDSNRGGRGASQSNFGSRDYSYGQDSASTGGQYSDSGYGNESSDRGQRGGRGGGPRGGRGGNFGNRGNGPSSRGGYGNMGSSDYGQDSSSGYGSGYQSSYGDKSQGSFRGGMDNYQRRDSSTSYGAGSTQSGFKKEPDSGYGSTASGAGARGGGRAGGKVSRWSADTSTTSYSPKASTGAVESSYSSYATPAVKTEPVSTAPTARYDYSSSQTPGYTSTYGQSTQPAVPAYQSSATQAYGYQQAAAPTPTAQTWPAAQPTTPAATTTDQQQQWSAYYQQQAQASQYYSQYYGQQAASAYGSTYAAK